MADAPTTDDPAAATIGPDDTIGFTGGEVKALGDGRVAGYLVRYGDPDTADIDGEFFTPETDFGLDTATKARIVYHHGLPRKGDAHSAALGRRKIGMAEVQPRADGLWAEGVLDLADPAVKALYDDVALGGIGWSSGSVSRLVERRAAVKGKVRIATWPIIEATLSANPVDKRNRAYAIKSLLDDDGEPAWPDAPLGLFAPPRAMRAALSLLLGDALDLLADAMTCARPKADRIDDAGAILDAYRSAASKVVAALMDDDQEAAKAILTNHGGRALADAAGTLVARTERLVADASVISGLYRKAADQRHAEGRHLSPAKRAAIKALADGLGALASVPPPKADPAAVRALRNRLLAARI